jgi:DNA-binding MarR family transcriptional regulator
MTGTSTTTPTDTAAERATPAQLAPSVGKVLTALHRLGQATAAATAAEAGLGYSTTTPKLRTLENQGLAEPFHSQDGRTLWRLTGKGRAYAEQEQVGDAGSDGAAERVNDAAALADLPDEGAAASAHRVEPADPADGSPRAEPDADAPAPAASTTQITNSADPAADAATDTAAATAAATGGRRASGTLRGAILDILEANPGQRYKVSELCKLINKACEGSGAKTAGAGAVVNAANKLVGTGHAVLAVEKPATFTLAETPAGRGTNN